MEIVQLATVTVTKLLLVFSYELTVRSPDLMPCAKDNTVCVTDLRHCDPPPPSSVLKDLDMSCSYDKGQKSMTCGWSEDSDDGATVTLIFRRTRQVISCQELFVPTEQLQITARIQSSDVEFWSQPHHVFLMQAMKPPPPQPSAVRSTDDSVVLRWTNNGSCRLRYRANATRTWSQVPEFDFENQMQVYTIQGLLPFTVYVADVSCCQGSGVWSNWSTSVSVRTLDRAPLKSPQVCSRLEKADSGGQVLHLMWKAVDPHEAGGRILGYQLSYWPVMEARPQDRRVLNVTEGVVALEVEEGTWGVTVAAFNTAGYGPAATLSVDTQAQKILPSVRNMWVSRSSSADGGLRVQWRVPTDPPPALPVSHVDVLWHPEANPSTRRWSTVNRSTTSLLIQDVDPEESYLIRVFTVHQHQCGPPQLLSASLQQGALKEPVTLKVIGVNKTAVTLMWAWQKKSGPIRVSGYSVMLRSNSEKQTHSLWPDQWQHTFLDLKPNTEYSLTLLADNVSRIILSVRTDFDEAPVVAMVTPLLLLAVIALIVSILSRTVYKGFFFPHVSRPQDSKAGQWMMDPNHKNSTERNILDIRDFQETDVLGVKSAIVVGPRRSDPQDDDTLLPLGHLVIKLSDLRLDTESDAGAPITAESQHQHHPPDRSREADPLLHQLLDRETSQQAGDTVKSSFHQLEPDAKSHTADQITCEEEYVVNSIYLGKVEHAEGSVRLITNQT